MTVTIEISDQIAQYLDELAYKDAQHLDEKLKNLLITEYQRRLAQYKLIDRQMSQKYQMSFENFEQQQVTKREEYSWEVESDAIAWETAVDGMQTVTENLKSLAK